MLKCKVKNQEKKNQKVIVALSGGIDSAVAALLLKRAGFNVGGVFLKLADSRRFREGEIRAKKIAKVLKIPLKVWDLRKEFQEKIIDYFLKEYQKGKTPNPCSLCNQKIKFGRLLEKVLAEEGDYLASGHYVRKKLTFSPATKEIKFTLLRAKDKKKDQSYFLWKLNQKQLKHLLFPLGNYTKREVKKLAQKFKLPVSSAKESQEICFVNGSLNDFLAGSLKPKSGEIRLEGEEINRGRHPGLAFYTIGQRKGLKLIGGPFWVLAKDEKRNLLIVTKNKKNLKKRELVFKEVNWISGRKPRLSLKVKAKIRYRANLVSAKIIKGQKVIFSRAQLAITPGQSIVFYRGEELLGGAIIK